MISAGATRSVISGRRYIRGDFHFHKHDEDDEFFLVLEGTLLIDFEDRDTVTLKPHEGYTVPRGVVPTGD